jgi:O-antigen/teichoic acid export membrane protein
LYISAVGALLTIGLNIWLVPQYSYLASAWITLLAYATMMLLSYWLGQKNYPIPYPVKRIAVYLLLTALMVFCSFYLFKSDLLAGNILFALFVIGTLMVEQKGIRQLLKQQ